MAKHDVASVVMFILKVIFPFLFFFILVFNHIY